MARSILLISLVFACSVVPYILLADAPAVTRVQVTNLDELRTVAGFLPPGTVVEIAPGTYELSIRLKVHASGTEDQPVTIRAKVPGAMRIRGENSFDIERSAHVILDGLTFDGSQGLRCQHSDHVRITNCRFQLKQAGKRKNWLSFDDSRQGRVDHCEFGARVDSGSYIHISRGNRYFRIDHNHFHDFHELGHNGGESIYLHGTGVWAIHAVVENNLFERCNGEGELIGIKSHRNIIRGNTFIDCRGAVSIRDGSFNSVCGNVFVALNEPRAAGVRIHGKQNAFVNNYLYGIDKPIECCWGETDAPHHENLTGHGTLTKLAFAYRASYDNLIAHNTLVACHTVFQWTKKQIPMEDVCEKMEQVERNGHFLAQLWDQETSQYRVGDSVEPPFPPRRWLILNNVMWNTPQLVRSKLARGARPPVIEEDFRWEGNLAFSSSQEFDVGSGRTFREQQLRFENSQLIKERPGVYRPGAGSTCLGGAKIDMQMIRPYVDRPEIESVLEAISDLGAEGFEVLTAADVGPHEPLAWEATSD